MIYRWKPQPDITAYELALCLHVLLHDRSGDVCKLPAEAQRHFVEHEDNKRYAGTGMSTIFTEML